MKEIKSEILILKITFGLLFLAWIFVFIFLIYGKDKDIQCQTIKKIGYCNQHDYCKILFKDGSIDGVYGPLKVGQKICRNY